MELGVSIPPPRNSRTAWENSSAPRRAIASTLPARSTSKARTRQAEPSFSVPDSAESNGERAEGGESGSDRVTKTQKRTRTLDSEREPRTRMARWRKRGAKSRTRGGRPLIHWCVFR